MTHVRPRIVRLVNRDDTVIRNAVTLLAEVAVTPTCFTAMFGGTRSVLVVRCGIERRRCGIHRDDLIARRLLHRVDVGVRMV